MILLLLRLIVIISTHTLTWSVTGRVLKCPDSMNISTHTLTWSVTLSSIADFCSSIYFNSHAHVERDNRQKLLERFSSISTHTLTWSVTNLLISIILVSNISTHTLTWSVTYPVTLSSLLSLFQLTRSRGA